MTHRAHPTTPTEEAVRRVVGEYLEMPGLSLSVPQAKRLWNLEAPRCEELLETLVDQHFLKRTSRGLYVRPTHN